MARAVVCGLFLVLLVLAWLSFYSRGRMDSPMKSKSSEATGKDWWNMKYSLWLFVSRQSMMHSAL